MRLLTARQSRGGKLLAFAQLAKLRVYQHLYEWMLVVLLLETHGTRRPGTLLALVLALATMVAIQSAACAADDVVGFRNGSDAENYRANALLAAPPKLLPKPLLTGRLSEREGVLFAVAASLTAVACAVGAVASLSWDIPPAAPLAYLAVFLCAFQYSWGLKLSYRPGGLELVIVVVNAGTVLLPYWSIAHAVSPLAVIVSALVSVWFLQVVCYGNAADREGDARANRRTLAVLASPKAYRAFLVALFVTGAVLTFLPMVLGLLPPVGILFVLPLFGLSTAQVYRGALHGDAREAMRIGFRCIDVGGIGLAVAILVS